VRSCNEDAFVVRDATRLWAVSDGMGGLHSGDVASGLVVSALGELQPANGKGLSEFLLRQSLHRANEELFRRGASQAERGPMGATVTVITSNGQDFFCLWAGDSRLYRLRTGKLTQLTRDHRYIQELLDAGVIREAEARQHPKRHVITRAIGVEKDLKLDIVSGTLEKGDVFMLATDGVTSVCTDEELADIIGASPTLDSAAEAVVERCLSEGAPDNLTIVLVEAG
jgi:serine/threonine protein phosphatase PrpC